MKIWIILAITINAYAFPTLERSPNFTRLAQQNNFSLQDVKIKPSTYFTNLEINDGNNEDDLADDNNFPDFITTGDWKPGSIIIAFLIGIYCFSFLALICDEYFLPCIERICEALDLSQDIAAATFMAMATSAPEFFVNVIGTFITQSDIGVGTVIGSSLFNTLGVAALGSLAASKPIQVDWWPVTRDCTIYLFSIIALAIMTWDGNIYWYEGLVLFIVYFLYFGIMFNNRRISETVRNCAKHFENQNDNSTKTQDNCKSVEPTEPIVYIIKEPIQYYSETKDNRESVPDLVQDVSAHDKSTFGNYLVMLCLIPIWPLKILLYCTVPNPKTHPKLFPLTFIICILFIGTNSYIVSWMISIIGRGLDVPDVVLGLTFLAAGGCLPEAVSIIIMSRKGNGKMGVSNALGANSMNIFLSLGLPWFIKTIILNVDGVPIKFIELESRNIVYIIIGLIAVVLTLFLILYMNKFMLSRRTGSLLLIAYLVFLGLAITSEVFLNKVAVS